MFKSTEAAVPMNSTVLTKTRYEPKRAETGQNKPKPAETTAQKCETTRNDSKVQNWGNLGFPTRFCFSNFQPKCPNLGILGQEISAF